MKKFVSIIAGFVFIAGRTFAQPPVPPQPPVQRELQSMIAQEGTLTEWITNEDYLYEGFYLQTSQEKIPVKFPPHLGSQITSQLKVGNKIRVNGLSEISPAGIKEFRMMDVSVNGHTIYDTPPQMAAPVVEKFTTGKENIVSVQKNREGDMVGLVLSHKMILRIPPHLLRQLAASVQPGGVVEFTGLINNRQVGEAVADAYMVVHCQTITLNGTSYITR
ncbi:hypothetical protein [Xanthocytophaga agilis]|uniref:Uncharacterized protein n=1 Tax=Xanthocytophaga agilis TaxID=3048010 RepID=A0AAE3RDE9_9BACT|nr:hypothetical protein [Xanthocytophaga agilis]MDJ1506622.1 hypothetical protein [Xanthocytophaga agilis]